MNTITNFIVKIHLFANFKGMQLVKSDFVNKTQVAISSAARKTSCSHGWLRLVVQCIFCAITVASFVLIVYQSFRLPRKPQSVGPRCTLHGCRVVCNETPFYGAYEEDIVFAVTEAESYCEGRIILTLQNPVFFNATLPPKWLSRLRTNIHTLAIFGGNLKHISRETFMTQFTGSMRRLMLVDITITNWRPDMLVGLSNLEDMCLIRCNILETQRNALEAVDDTLKILAITSSGEWNPANLTGSTQLQKLSQVVFSSNNFTNILDHNSFSRLEMCKEFYLNSCGIVAIGAGAFNSLHHIQVIYLNNNLLTTVPPGLFDMIVLKGNPRPRINLQYNKWVCDCSYHDLRVLSREGLLIIDPVCHYPDELKGQSFTEFEEKCSNSTEIDIRHNHEKGKYVYLDGACSYDNITVNKNGINVISPINIFQCTKNTFRSFNLSTVSKNDSLRPQDMLRPTFAIKNREYSMVEISTTERKDYGLIWFQSQCPNTIYCINTLPEFVRVYNLDTHAQYTFCPVQLGSDMIESISCVEYSMSDTSTGTLVLRIMVYVSTAVASLIFGAMCVYAIIRKFPSLLKGSSRVLFVKHKNVDALILPPKVPLRSHLLNDVDLPGKKDIFIVPERFKDKCVRRNSIGSYKSSAPSYISALQPTEDQLIEWRLRNLDSISAITACSMDFGFPSYTILSDDNSLYYSVSHGSGTIYETLK